MIVGVGGFLGIGEKSVAIDMSAFQVVPASTGTSTSVGAASADADPTNVKLKVSWTKDQLKNAPDFQYYKSPAATRTSDRPGASPTTGMAPRPANPAPAAVSSEYVAFSCVERMGRMPSRSRGGPGRHLTPVRPPSFLRTVELRDSSN